MKTWSQQYFRYNLEADKNSPCLPVENCQRFTQFMTKRPLSCSNKHRTKRFVDHVNSWELVVHNRTLFWASLTGGSLHGCNVRM